MVAAGLVICRPAHGTFDHTLVTMGGGILQPTFFADVDRMGAHIRAVSRLETLSAYLNSGLVWMESHLPSHVINTFGKGTAGEGDECRGRLA